MTRPKPRELRQQLVDWAKGKVASWGQPAPAAPAVRASAGSAEPGTAGIAAAAGIRPLRAFIPSPAGRGAGGEGGRNRRHVPPSHPSPRSPSALQIHNRYLVTETDEGVTIIDQHALHERILYEQLRQRVAAGAIETQTLLVPEPVDLGPAERAAALEHRDLLAELGVKMEPFGGNTLLVAAYPAMLANLNPVEILRALLERILAERQTARPPRPVGRSVAHDRLQGGDQGGRPARAGGDYRALGAAAPDRRRPSLSARPSYGAGVYAGGVGQAIQASLGVVEMLLFKKKFLPAIRAGQKTQTIRLWKYRRLRAVNAATSPAPAISRSLPSTRSSWPN